MRLTIYVKQEARYNQTEIHKVQDLLVSLYYPPPQVWYERMLVLVLEHKLNNKRLQHSNNG
jgi:hypothetical protein